MTADALKSVSITNLDTFGTSGGPIANTTGFGAPELRRTAEDYVTPTTGGLASTSSKYKMLRFRSGVYLKKLTVISDGLLDTGGGSAALAIDVGAYYSDSTVDGTLAANQGNSISVNCFIAAAAFSQGASTEVISTDGGSTYTAVLRQEPLWQAAGLTADPGGFIDIVVAVHTAANTAASVNLSVRAEFVDA